MLNLIVLKSDTYELSWLESFSQQFNWKVKTTTDITESFHLIIKQNPDYVLVSADHPNRQANLLAKLTAGNSVTTLIGFTENSKGSSMTKLHALGFKHLLYPPISSQDIFNLINKIEKIKKINSEKPISNTRKLINVSNSTQDYKKSGFFIFKGLPWASSHTIIKGKANQESSKRPSTNMNLEIWEPLMNACVEALNKVLGQNEMKENCTRISDVTEVSCLKIDSVRISGIMVIATGKNEALDEGIKNHIQQTLYETLANKGFNSLDIDGNTPPLKITKVSFYDWALRKADFTLNSVYQNDEIALSFFSTSELKTAFENSHSEEMFQIKYSEIEVGTKASFQLFIYLPNNKKYVVFNKEDTALSISDFDRLKRNSIAHIHFKKENLPQFKQVKAQNFLNRQIDSLST